MLMNIIIISFMVLFLGTVPYKTDSEIKTQILNQIEASIYAPNYTDYDVYTVAPETMTTARVTYELTDASKQQIVELWCLRLTNKPYEKNIIIDKSKVVPAYWSSLRLEDIVQIKDGNLFVHDILPRRLIRLRPTTLAKDKILDTYYWMELEVNTIDKALYIDFISNLSSSKNLHDVFWEEGVWEQLKKSKLDLNATQAMMSFSFDSSSFGIIFYDNSVEYYMSLFGHLLTMGSSDLFGEPPPSEITEARTLKAFQLYDIRNELAPLLIKQYEIESTDKNT